MRSHRKLYAHIEKILEDKTVCCLTCKYFKVKGDIGECKNAKSTLYLDPIGLQQLLSSLSASAYKGVRNGRCPHYINEADGTPNVDIIFTCHYCARQLPYKDFYDKFAMFCSKECRQKFNDDFNIQFGVYDKQDKFSKYY